MIHKPSLGSCEVTQKIWSRLVMPFWHLLNTNRQTNRQTTKIYDYAPHPTHFHWHQLMQFNNIEFFFWIFLLKGRNGILTDNYFYCFAINSNNWLKNEWKKTFCEVIMTSPDLGVRMKRFQSLVKSLSVSRGEYFPGVMMGKHVMKLIRGKN